MSPGIKGRSRSGTPRTTVPVFTERTRFSRLQVWPHNQLQKEGPLPISMFSCLCSAAYVYTFTRFSLSFSLLPITLGYVGGDYSDGLVHD